MDSNSEPEYMLRSLISQLISLSIFRPESEQVSLLIQIKSLVTSMDLDLESEFISLVKQATSVFTSMDLDSQPKPLKELISFISPKISMELDLESLVWELDLESLIRQTLSLKPEPEIISLIYQIFATVMSTNSKWKKLILLSPQLSVQMQKDGKFHLLGEFQPGSNNNKWECLPHHWEKFRLFTGGKEYEYTHFICLSCNGKNHKENSVAPVEIKHPLHPKHPLKLVWNNFLDASRECYCCDDYLIETFYYCPVCDFAMNIACVEMKQPALAINYPNWHEHTLAHFPRLDPITCNLCALVDSKCSAIYMCPPCGFVVHQTCLRLPRVIRISRHLHRISFTHCFDQGDWFCAVCRGKIENDYGGYSCIKEGCCYAAHSKCATQSNVWDGIELEGEPEEIEEEVEPFVRISDGIIEHFSHQHHHLRLDENTGRDYDDNKECQACITPIYFGNLYSCMHCDFILHEECANLPRKMHHPIHPHLLTLVTNDRDVFQTGIPCSACLWLCTGFFYKCGKKECEFKLNVQCATISEPLVHESHTHPLFLTSKPGEERLCHVCDFSFMDYEETFNCIECDFSLCFRCATIPQMVRYKHDKHPLTLSYGKETSTMTYWCEACERKIKPKKRFYKCDEYCCVTLHIKCLIGKDLYMKPGSSFTLYFNTVSVLPNNHHMSRPICSNCKKRCPYKIVFQCSRLLFCSCDCIKIFCFKESRAM